MKSGKPRAWGLSKGKTGHPYKKAAQGALWPREIKGALMPQSAWQQTRGKTHQQEN